MYDLFCDIKGGADKQNMIFRQKNIASRIPFNNKGSGPNGRMTYSEFQWRLQKKGLIPNSFPTNLPNPMDDPHKAAKDLLDRGWNGNLLIEDIDDSFNSWSKPANDPHAEKYSALIDKIEKQYSKFRQNTQTALPITGDRYNQFDKLGKAIVRLRQLETQDWVSRYFSGDPSTDPKKAGGLGLKDIVTNEVESNVGQIKEKYKVVDVIATFQKYTNTDGTLKPELSKHFANQEAMLKWIDEQGNPNSGLNYSDSSKSHYRALKSWKTFAIKHGMTRATLMQCAL